MYAIRTLLSYSLVIIIVAAVVLAYYYRDQIMPEVDAVYDDVETWVSEHGSVFDETGQTQTGETAVEQSRPEGEAAETQTASGESVVAVTEMPAESGEAVVSVPETSEESDEAAASVTETPAESEETVVAITEPEANKSASDLDVTGEAETGEIPAGKPAPSEPVSTEIGKEPSTAVTEKAPATTEPPASNVTPQASGDMMASTGTANALPETQLQQTDEQPATMPEATVSDNGKREQELLNQARQAYWQRHYDDAVVAYKKLLRMNPENPDLYGELGNLYYTMGAWELAGEAYYQASQRLLKTGQTAQLGYLLRVIKGLNPDLADKLEQDIKHVN
jgi:hypothetical protein